MNSRKISGSPRCHPGKSVTAKPSPRKNLLATARLINLSSRAASDIPAAFSEPDVDARRRAPGSGRDVEGHRAQDPEAPGPGQEEPRLPGEARGGREEQPAER